MTDRRPNPSDPTAERTSEQTTPGASGLTGGRAADIEQGRRNEGDELIPREGEDERDRNPVMPGDEANLRTEI